MNRKLKNTLALVALLILLLLAGGIYVFVYQRGKLEAQNKKLSELRANNTDSGNLLQQLKDLQKQEAALDSVLAARKFNIPQNLSSIKFYDFLNTVCYNFSDITQVDVELVETKQDKNFIHFEYKISGSGEYNDVYRLVYSIEGSKELKKIRTISFTNQVKTDKDSYPHYVVGFTLTADVFFSSEDRFITSVMKENNLIPAPSYDIFYPVIRTEIPANLDGLLDVQGARLLALIPEGAFLSDTKGNTFLLWEGEPVYLGYLTNINYEHNQVNFILNKGGIIEKVTLMLEKENPNELKREIKK